MTGIASMRSNAGNEYDWNHKQERKLQRASHTRRGSLGLMDESLREELKAMATEDRRLRQELLESGELEGGYAPRMEALHRKNTFRLKEIIAKHGWPDRELVGDEGTSAAWLIVAARH